MNRRRFLQGLLATASVATLGRAATVNTSVATGLPKLQWRLINAGPTEELHYYVSKNMYAQWAREASEQLLRRCVIVEPIPDLSAKLEAKLEPTAVGFNAEPRRITKS